MFSLKSLLVAAAIASTGAFAQLVNPITRPTVGDILVAGTSFDITWTVTTPGVLVSLILREGPSTNIGVVGPIADSIPNSGSFLWNIPTNLPSGNDYAVQIIEGPASNVSNVGPDEYNFTPLLTLVNNSTNIPSSNSSTTASSAASSTSAASSASSQASSQAASSEASTTTNAGKTTTATTGATATAGGASGSTTESASSAATHASSAARIDGSLMSGHGFFALVIAVAVGIMASV